MFVGDQEERRSRCTRKPISRDNLPQETQAAILSVASFGFSSYPARMRNRSPRCSTAGRPLAERLKNLPRRHLIFKTVHERWCEAVVPTVREPDIDPSDLYRRSMARWARPRREIEEEIQKRRRRSDAEISARALDGWE